MAVDQVNPGFGLTQWERGLLEFERRTWRLPMAKEQEIRATFDISGPRYYQALNALIDRPEALAADPLLVKRLRRMRAQRRMARSGLQARNQG